MSFNLSYCKTPFLATYLTNHTLVYVFNLCVYKQKPTCIIISDLSLVNIWRVDSLLLFLCTVCFLCLVEGWVLVGEHSFCGVLGYDAMWSGRWTTVLQMHVLLPSLGRSAPSKWRQYIPLKCWYPRDVTA
jgi:hypothetical protein